MINYFLIIIIIIIINHVIEKSTAPSLIDMITGSQAHYESPEQHYPLATYLFIRQKL